MMEIRKNYLKVLLKVTCFISFIGIILYLLGSLSIEVTIPVQLIKVEEDKYQTYLTESALSKIKTQGKIVVNRKVHEYTELEEVESFNLGEDNYCSIIVQINTKVNENFISGVFKISKSTFIKELITTLKEEILLRI